MKRTMIFLISLLLLFGILFLIAIINLNRRIPLLGLGIDYGIEDWFFIALIFLAIIKVFHTIATTKKL